MWVSAFVARGVCTDLPEHCEREHEIIGSVPILSELDRVLVEKIGIPGDDASLVLATVESAMEVVGPSRLSAPVSRDPDDDLVLATAVAGRCDCIITGDRDLLILENYEGIAIVRPSEFWRYEATREMQR